MMSCYLSYRKTRCNKSVPYNFYLNVWHGVYATCSGTILEEGNFSKNYRSGILVDK